MSFPGPRPRKEPSPPFKDPNPDKAKALASLKSGKKIVKLTKIGERIKKKIESKNKNLWPFTIEHRGLFSKLCYG